jgi:PAS domain S-box-containing protein
MTIESMVIDNSVSRYIEGTKSITSRSMIRKRILDYRNGEVTLKELKTYTQPKYQDGIKALEDCVYASRWVNQQQVAGYNQIRVNAIKNILADTSRQRLTSGFVLNDSHDNMLVYVISPIRPKDSHEVIGYDIALFSNPVLWQRIQHKDFSLDVYQKSGHQYSSGNDGYLKLKKNDTLLINGKNIQYQVKSKFTNAFYVFTVSHTVLFDELQIFYKNQLVVLLLLAFVILLVLFIIQRRRKFIFFQKQKYLEGIIDERTESLKRTVNELVETQKRVEKSEQKFSSAFMHAPYPKFIARLSDGKFIEVNEIFLRHFGYERSEIMSKTFTELEIWNALKDRDIFISNLTKNQRIDTFDTTLQKKSGNRLHCLISANIIEINGEQCVLNSIIDITERNKAEQTIKTKNIELEKLNKDKNRFMSILSHDLRSPFSSLISFSEMLLENIDTYPKEITRQRLGMINSSIANTYNLLDDLLIWSKSQSGQMPFVPEQIDFRDIALSIIEEFTQRAYAKGITCNYDEEDSTILMADLNMLQTILRNLVSNAIKFCHANGHISIQAAPNEGFSTISVIDDGIGMNEHQQQKIWDTSQAFTTKGTNNERGTGLGLKLCKEFVELHGGSIWIESQEGVGSHFKFTMPALIEQNQSERTSC